MHLVWQSFSLSSLIGHINNAHGDAQDIVHRFPPHPHPPAIHTTKIPSAPCLLCPALILHGHSLLKQRETRSMPQQVSSYSDTSLGSCPSFSSSEAIINPSNDDPAIDSANRTLGFYPISEKDFNSEAININDELYLHVSRFMTKILGIPYSTVISFKAIKIWYSNYSQTVYVEFFFPHMCHCIFKHLKNLSGPYRVFKFIPPSYKHQFRILTDQAYRLRNSSSPHQTKIEFLNNGLVLSAKKSLDFKWRKIASFHPPNTRKFSPLESQETSHLTSSSSPNIHQNVTSDYSNSIDCEDSSNIPQTDGNVTLVDEEEFIPSILGAPPVSNLVAKFTLNKKKQLTGLAKHAKLPDFWIEIKDSGRNINVQCSTGFYEAVAKPAFSSLSKGFKHQSSSFSLECSESRNLLDQASSLPGLLLRFKLYGVYDNPEPLSLSVHLHHTQQKIQIQGGASMPDKTTLAGWFLHNVLKQRFADEAKNKKFDIDFINRTVSSIGINSTIPSSSMTMPAMYCSHCQKKFCTNAKPIKCPKCSNFKHTKKCAPCPPYPPGIRQLSQHTSFNLFSSKCQIHLPLHNLRVCLLLMVLSSLHQLHCHLPFLPLTWMHH